MLNVVSGYDPQVGCELEERKTFWRQMDEEIQSVFTEGVVIGATLTDVGKGKGRSRTATQKDKSGIWVYDVTETVKISLN